jgi:hypothetical protein
MPDGVARDGQAGLHSPAVSSTPPPSPDWQQDLSCILGGVPLQAQVRPRAYAMGKPIAWEEAVTLAGTLLQTSRRPAMLGLHTLTIESLRIIVAIARKHRGCLLPRPDLASPLRLTQPITLSATLGHLMQCPLLLGIGVKASELPHRLPAPDQRFERLPDSLELVIELRQALKAGDEQHPFIRLLTQQPRTAVVLASWCEERVVSQWHRLAAEIQTRTRMAVVSLPDPEALNAKGVEAVIAWQTACSIATGGVSFFSGNPTPCSPWDAMLTQQQPDVIVDTSRTLTDIQSRGLKESRVIRIGSEMDAQAAVSFVVPDLAIGTRGRVMRFDGQILWLCHDPAQGQPDLTALLLQEIFDASSRSDA